MKLKFLTLFLAFSIFAWGTPVQADDAKLDDPKTEAEIMAISENQIISKLLCTILKEKATPPQKKNGVML